MKSLLKATLLCLATSFVLVSCDTDVNVPPAEKNDTTIVNPPDVTKEENTTVINPPPEKKE